MSALYSSQFNDIYFSDQDGLAESIHTFIEANDIKKRIIQKKHLRIGELGFGTGLNFLAIWDYIEKHSSGTSLEYWSIEKYPLAKESINQALSHWDSLNQYKASFLKCYEINGNKNATIENSIFKFRLNKNIHLNLLIGDAAKMISHFPDKIDCWFLDGFAPEKNPEMWSPGLLKACFEKSAPEATATTFTAAGLVKRNLRDAGFYVKREKGFGKKRHMVKAWKKEPSSFH